MLPWSEVAAAESNYRLYSTALSLRLRLTLFFRPLRRAGGCCLPHGSARPGSAGPQESASPAHCTQRPTQVTDTFLRGLLLL